MSAHVKTSDTSAEVIVPLALAKEQVWPVGCCAIVTVYASPFSNTAAKVKSDAPELGSVLH